MGLHTVTTDGTPLLVTITGQSILLEDANSVILAYGMMKQSGFHADWKEGTASNPHDGGCLRMPDGKKVKLRFDWDLWHLPEFATPTPKPNSRKVKAMGCNVTPYHDPNCCITPPPQTRSANPFALLTDDSLSEPSRYPVPASAQWTLADVEEAHESWCHPGHSMTDEIIQEYPELFPKDSKFRAAARQHRCPVCTLMKGARTYRKGKKMKKQRRSRNAPLGDDTPLGDYTPLGDNTPLGDTPHASSHAGTCPPPPKAGALRAYY